MNIKIWDDKYAIKSDARCYRLVELKENGEDPDNEEGFTIGYYSTIAALFKNLAEREERFNKCTTLDGYIKHIEKVNKKLEENLLAIAAIVGKKETLERILYSMPEVPESIAASSKKEKRSKL